MKHPNIIMVRGFSQTPELGVMVRVESRHVGSFDADGDPYGTGYAQLYAYEYPILKVTRCGKWIRAEGERKFVLDTSRKRFAHETLELALESFRARRERQISILKARLAAAEQELALANVDPVNPDVFHMNHARLAQLAGVTA